MKIPTMVVAEMEKFTLKFIWNFKGPPNNQSNLG